VFGRGSGCVEILQQQQSSFGWTRYKKVKACVLELNLESEYFGGGISRRRAKQRRGGIFLRNAKSENARITNGTPCIRKAPQLDAATSQNNHRDR